MTALSRRSVRSARTGFNKYGWRSKPSLASTQRSVRCNVRPLCHSCANDLAVARQTDPRLEYKFRWTQENIGRLHHRAGFGDIQDLTAERTMTTVEDDHGHLQNSLAITARRLSSLVPPDDPCASLTLTESHGRCDRSIMRGDLKIEGIERQTLCHRQSRWSLYGGLGRTLNSPLTKSGFIDSV